MYTNEPYHSTQTLIHPSHPERRTRRSRDRVRCAPLSIGIGIAPTALIDKPAVGGGGGGGGTPVIFDSTFDASFA